MTGPWFVYMLRCGDGTLYTGITNNLEKRLKAHRDGTGAVYTRNKQPLEIVWTMSAPDKSTALRWEYRVKNRTKKQKEEMVAKVSTRSSTLEGGGDG